MKRLPIRSSLFALIVSFHLLCLPISRAEPRSAAGPIVGRPFFRVFSDRDGLPQNAVRTMAFDRYGYIWIGTKDGAAVYNGRTWRTVHLPNRDKSNFVTVARPALDGGMWFGTEGGGLLHLKDDRWTIVEKGSGLPGNEVTAVLETRAALWVATQNGVACREGDRWRTFTTADGLLSEYTLCLLEATDAVGKPVLLLGTTKGIAVWRNGAWTRTTIDLPNPWVLSLLDVTEDDGTRRLFVGTQGGLFSLDFDDVLAGGSAGVTVIDKPVREAAPPFVFSLLASTNPQGKRVLWAGTNLGLWHRTNGGWRLFTQVDGLPVNGIWSLAESPRGTVWIGTSGGGIARWSQGGWRSFTTANGLAGNSTYSLMETIASDGSSALWIGSLGGLVRLAPGARTTFPENDLGNVVALAAHRSQGDGEIVWAGTTGGLYEHRGNIWRQLTDGVVTSLAVQTDREGHPVVWAGTIDGLFEFGTRTTRRFTTADGLPGNRVRCLLPTRGPDGTPGLWIGTQNGLALASIADDGFATLGTALAGKLVMGLLETTDRRLWIGTGNGVLRAMRPDVPTAGSIAGMTWETLTESTSPALPNNTVYQLREDRKNRVYLCTNKGVARLTPPGGNANAPLAQFTLHTYTIADGLPSNECNTGASMVDSRGRIWVGTIAGVAVLDPDEEFSDTIAKPLHIESARFYQQAATADRNSENVAVASFRLPPERIDLPYSRNNATFSYALLSFLREPDTAYRTQLIGLEQQPTDWTTATQRDYTTLPGGDYVFRVWGRDAEGNVSGPTEIAFTIRPAPWRTWWAYGLYAVAAGLAVAGGYRFRLRRLVARQEQLHRLVAERTRDLTEEKERTDQALDQIRRLNDRLALANAALQDANMQERERALRAIANAQQSQLLMLRYQVNPHFLFNVLNSIWALVDENPAGIRTLVNRLSKFLRYSLATSNTSLVTLGEEIAAVQNYLEIQRIRFEEKLETRIDIAPEAGKIEIPAFLIQPLVENAIKYGMQTSSLPVRLHVTATVRYDTLTIRIANSGKWVAPSATPRDDSTGIGLNNVRQRLAEAYPGTSGLRIFHRRGWVWLRVRISRR